MPMSLGELTVAAQDHGERIVALEEGSKHIVQTNGKLERKIDRLQNWILGLLGTAVLQLVLALLKK